VSRRVRILLVVGTVVSLLVAAAELVLPSVAARRLASSLERLGPGPEVEVAAQPALKLLAGDADRVEIRMATARVGPMDLAERLSESGETDVLRVRVGELRIGPLVLRDARLDKDGDTLTGEAGVDDADLQAVLPAPVDLRPLPGEPGEGLLFEGSATAFGQTVSARARLRAVDGRITLQAEGLLSAFANVTVFGDPRLQVTELTASPREGGTTVRVTGRLRER
jgi:hypothetical protein